MINFTLDITQLTQEYRADNGNYVLVKNEGKEIGNCKIRKSGRSIIGEFTVSELPVSNSAQPLFSKWMHNDYVFFEGLNFIG